MEGIIQLLPDSVANQIAAGEVVQRPASVVKELMENAIDAGATEIDVIIKDAGRTLIQVLDNGKGMSPPDARLSLERHATSKIKSADDLFSINTMGFRGEALPSIVAVAQCELKSKGSSEDIGTRIVVEGSEVHKQEATTCAQGTSFSVKNLFYNIPARRKFLKSNAVENRHIIDQFERIVLIYPDIRFTLTSDGNQLFVLEPGNLRQRIVAVFGKNYNSKLVPIEEESNIVNLEGFILKPEFSRKTRGEQYLFVNNRFIKSHYLHNAISAAYEILIPHNHHPGYFISLHCDPSTLDVNIHPTKTEVKFEEEKSIYAIIRSSVRKALGEHNISPTLDFERETAFDGIRPDKEIKEPKIKVDPGFNPFSEKAPSGTALRVQPEHWQKMFESPEVPVQQEMEVEQEETTAAVTDRKIFQFAGRYILSPLKNGIMVIDQQRAHERVLFERFLSAIAQNKGACQQTLFPVNVELSAQLTDLVNQLLPDLRSLGFDIDSFGQNAFIIRGVPAELSQLDAAEVLDDLLANFQKNESELKSGPQVNIAYSLAQKGAIKNGRMLTAEEMSNLVDELFGCENPQHTPNGKRIIQTLELSEMNERFD
jgi:DNA mismatch repair protein MutL